MSYPQPQQYTSYPPEPAHPPHQALPSSASTSSTSTALGPPVTHALPTVESLLPVVPALDGLGEPDRLAWAQDVLRVLDRHLYPAGQSDSASQAVYTPRSPFPAPLAELLDTAIPIIISDTTHADPKVSSLASYLKAKLLASGSCPDYLPRDPRQAFKDFESAARGGEVRGWFRLGRDYEGVGDIGRARDCFERGSKKGDVECTYVSGRMRAEEGVY
jgi:hypothetical protein